MKILLIHQAFVGPHEAGGTRHYEFARRLVDDGHQFTIVAGSVSYLTGQRVEGPRDQDLDGVEVRRAYTHPAFHRSYLWRLVSFVSFMVSSVWRALWVRDVDVVMGTSPPMFQAVSAWLVSLLKRRPLLLEIRDLWPAFAIDIGLLKNPVIIWVARRLERFLYRRARHIVVNSPAYRDYLIGLGVPAAKISLIPNGVDSRMFQGADGAALRRELGLDGKFVVTYAGAIGMANDLDALLEAADQLRDEPRVQLLVVGDGKERARLAAEAERRGLDNLRFVGPRPKDEMPAVLAASDACVAILRDIPMFKTTYPNKVFDYMAAGRPTILAIDGVIREVVEDSQGGIAVGPGDPAAIAAAARRLAADPRAAVAMGEAAQRYVAEHFDRDRQAAEFAAVATRLRAA